MLEWLGCDAGVYRFAAPAEAEDLVLSLALIPSPEPADETAPEVRLVTAPSGTDLRVEEPGPDGRVAVRLRIPAAPPEADDDELTFRLEAEAGGRTAPCEVVLRRTRCRISTALVIRGPDAAPLRPQTRAALLWYGWRRYRELVALKRFTSGKSGSDVLVFRPRLRDPSPEDPSVRDVCHEGVVERAWGANLLVKTGPVEKMRPEWERFDAFLRDRQHPFMARSEAFLRVLPAEAPPAETPEATVVGSFLGGELVEAEALEMLAQGSADAERCVAAIDRLFSVLATWYEGADPRPLGEWRDVFSPAEDGGFLLFGRYDLSRREDRERFAGALVWDVAFVKGAHLSHHLLGKGAPGLLQRLMELPVRYSLVHGDLHPRNVLADQDNVWLLDFGETGVAPTLFDFAKLEIYLRLWCLRLSPGAQDFEDAAIALESHLLDHMTASEGSLEPVAPLAGRLGAGPADLLKIARCIAAIRRRAARYGSGSPDRRDYLAVLYLTALRTVRYAGTAPELAPNFRLLVGMLWVLEDALSPLVGLAPFSRERRAFDPRALVGREWLAGRGVPGRVLYLMERPDGDRALAPLAATRGVMQGLHHHLDVFDHTLLVLAYLEELLEDPVAGLRDPEDLDARTDRALAAQGIALGPRSERSPAGAPAADHVADAVDEVRELLAGALDEEARLLLKWVALFHDVGKPATRCMTAGRDGRPRVQFLGHEVYGMQLVGEHLDLLYPEPEPRARADRLMRWHHAHHALAARYAEPRLLEALREGVAGGALSGKEASFLLPYLDPEGDGRGPDFPLLIVHGFADAMACRGPLGGPMGPVAELDLLLLAAAARYPALRRRRELEDTFRSLVRGLNEALDLTGPPLGRVIGRLREWFLGRALDAGGDGDAVPSREEVVRKGIEIRDALGLAGEE